MRAKYLTAIRLSSAILLSTGLFGCESMEPLGVDGVQASSARGASAAAPIEIRISDVRSGLPERPAGMIDLRDAHLWIEILDVESYLPRSANANSLRLGESWEIGTPAERFQLVDLDADGRRDVRIWFSLQQLIDEGRIGAETTDIVLWGRDARSGETYRAAATVAVVPPPVGQGSLVGRVVDASTGAPIVGASASLIGVRSATTDADGRFVLDGILPGAYNLDIWRSGFLGEVIGVQIEEGETTEVGTVTLQAIPVEAWTYNANGLRGRNGEQFVHHCPAGGIQRNIWGTDLYTDDSPICVAAVHVGEIGFATGGRVVFEVRPGSSGYVGTLRNGVQSLPWGGSWGGSFVIVRGSP